MMPSVSVLVSTHNGWENGVLKGCIQSLMRQDYPNFEIIVVDNCSTDGSAEKIREWYEDSKEKISFRVIKNNENNVAKAVNIAIKQSKTKYMGAFADDTEMAPDALSKIIEAMENDKRIGVAMFRSMNYFEKNKIDSVGDSFDFYGNAEVGGYGEEYTGQYSGVRDVLLVGVACIFRRKIVGEIGDFDEMFHVGHEDADFCIRARLGGYRVVSVSNAVVFHKRGSSYKNASEEGRRVLEFIKFNFYKDQLMILIKMYEIKNLIKAVPIAICMSLIIGIYQAVFQKRPKEIWLRMKSIFWVVYHLGYILKQRNFVQKIRKVPDSEIIKYMAENQYIKYLKLLRK